ncbi:MAG: O-methyltransferase [Ignavibacteriales bacterium]|nr:O-methyltransferase [Ignavibacteriales bacterium]
MPQSKILYPEQQNYLSSFIGEKDSLLIEMEKFARENNIPILDKNAAEFLEVLLTIYEPKTFLEIGTAIGYSTIRVAKILKNSNYIHTIEFSEDNFKLANQYIAKANLTDKIVIFRGNALQIIPDLKDVYDFIFLDADKEDYLALFNLAIKKLKSGGVILVDNLLWKGFAASTEIPEKYKKSTELIKEFNANFMNTPSLKSIILPIGDGLGVGIKTK